MHTYTLVSAVIAGASLVLASPAPKPAPAPMITPGPVPYLVQRAINPRDHDDEELTPQELTCQSKLQSLINKIPRVQSEEVNSQLRSYLSSKSNAVQTLPPNSFGEMCSVIYNDSNIPASVSSDWKIYTDKAISVVNSIKPEVNSLVPQCGVPSGAIGVWLITDEKSCKTAYENYMAAYQDHITESIEGTATQRAQTGATSTVKLATGSGRDATSAAGSEETASAERANASSTSGSAASSSSSVAGAAGPRETGYVAVAAAAAMAVAGAMAAL